jgi:SPP1 gp7 family putative phage head morphogenesis protein
MNQFDSAVELQLDIMRVAAGIERDVLRILLTMQRDLIAQIAGGQLTEWSKARVNAQLRETKVMIAEYYDWASSVAQDSVSAISDVSARVTAGSLAQAATIPAASTLESIASNAVIQGAVMRDWWAKQSADTAFRFAQAVRQGVAGGQTNQQIIAQVRGFLETSRAGAAALVQTSVATVANDTRQAVFDRNADIIRSYRAVATLDTNTCLTCAPLDGLEWEPDGTPIGHSFPKPRYPLHYNCRCLLIPRVLDGEQGGQRAAAGGPVSANLTFSGWLERQSKAKQTEILGKGRAELYRSGKLTLRDLVGGRGNPLSLDELKSKYA